MTVYDGIAVTRGSVPSGKRAETDAMGRTAFFTRSAVSYIDFIVVNYHGAETPTGSAMSAKIGVEYPAASFASTASTTIPNGGQSVMRVYVNIPANTKAWFLARLSNPSGIPWNAFQGQDLTLGDALIVGDSSVPDLTEGGTVTDGGTFGTIGFLAGIAPISIPSVCILGDSIALGVDNDHTPNSVGDAGAIAPSIGPSFGYSNMGVNAETANSFVGTHTNRLAVLQYCSHVIVEYGTNDINTFVADRTVAQLKADLTTIYGYATGKTIFQTTLLPRTQSTDSFATTVNQTPDPSESKRVTFNTDLRAATFGPNGGYFDPESVVGTGTNNSLWKVAPSLWTNDGVHPNTYSYYTQLQNSGFISTSRIFIAADDPGTVFLVDEEGNYLMDEFGNNLVLFIGVPGVIRKPRHIGHIPSQSWSFAR